MSPSRWAQGRRHQHWLALGAEFSSSATARLCGLNSTLVNRVGHTQKITWSYLINALSDPVNIQVVSSLHWHMTWEESKPLSALLVNGFELVVL
ncbi:hypothetical protein GUJ93_ZPchr0006g45765 [Zizania palustris]|uniref:Uncharacterized protein n=1 Tax=Zizania palustris TaxID=103762 RepID=A0A8J5W1H5_ZIZPA|nr:hypothetical protein GUJ93_ZPchr0006g45765 [Zizania palustris]